jgi:hypothetical protein
LVAWIAIDLMAINPAHPLVYIRDFEERASAMRANRKAVARGGFVVANLIDAVPPSASGAVDDSLVAHFPSLPSSLASPAFGGGSHLPLAIDAPAMNIHPSPATVR